MLSLAFFVGHTQAQTTPTPAQKAVLAGIDKQAAHYGELSRQIWDYAEVGYQETKSSALLQEELKKEGFTVQAGVAGIPTAFVATYGSGKPVIGILAEYDALPGLSQEATPERKPIAGQKAGHGCGHNLFGTASVASAIAVKTWLQQPGHTGTIKLYGCPAEEGGSGKVYMVREGLFTGTDVVLHWHPGDKNGADAGTSMANITGKFRFHGVSAHAAAAPERGRSALDGVEAMDNMVNMMREHIPSDTRIHYIITRGGDAPNVVPDFAEVYYYARNKNRAIVQDVWQRIIKAAEGAAMGTGTTVEVEVIGGVFNLLPVESLARLMHKNLAIVGGVTYTPDETKFAEKLDESFGLPAGSVKKPSEAATVAPFTNTLGNDALSSGSTDVGDVSWAVPTVGLSTATWVPGTAAHSWQAVVCSGTTIGQKGMIVAAKTLSLTAIDLFSDPKLVDKAHQDWLDARGKDFKYEALLGNRKPALDYRK